MRNLTKNKIKILRKMNQRSVSNPIKNKNKMFKKMMTITKTKKRIHLSQIIKAMTNRSNKTKAK